MLKEKLQADVKEALKSGNANKRMVLGLVLSAVKSRELEKRSKLNKTPSTGSTSSQQAGSGQAETDPAKLEELIKLNDEEVVEVLSFEVKKRKDSIEQYEKGGRPELAQKEQEEIKILMGYMPEQMSEEAIRDEVKKTVNQTGASGPRDMGKVIGAVMAKVKGKADGQVVSRIVKEELQKSA